MSRRILVVEDQEDLRAILRDFLSASGYTVIEAVDGAGGCASAIPATRAVVMKTNRKRRDMSSFPPMVCPLSLANSFASSHRGEDASNFSVRHAAMRSPTSTGGSVSAIDTKKR